MRSIESTGKTVEEAVQAGLSKLGLELSDVTISVVEEGSKGFFGLFGAKPAKVRITERDREDEIDISQILRPGASTRVSTIADKPRQPKPQAKPVQAQPKPAQPQAKPTQAQPKPVQVQAQAKPQPQPKPAQVQPQAQANKPTQPQTKPAQQNKPAQPQVKPNQANKPAQPQAKPAPANKPAQSQSKPAQPQANKPADAQSKPAQPKPQRPARPQQPRTEVVRPTIPSGPLPDQDPATLSDAGRAAYEYLDKLTRLMGVPVKIYVAEGEGSMSISMMGDTLGILIGRRGDTLDALQYLTSLEVNRNRDEYIRVSLDTEHYRAKREESLNKLAMRMAERAVKSGRKVVLEPMNPYERRVLHATLQDHPYVQTHSEGDEPNRRVVITLKGDAANASGDANARPAKRGPRPERRDQKQGERRDNRAPKADKPQKVRAPRPESDKPASPTDVPMAHDVPEDPTDDTI